MYIHAREFTENTVSNSAYSAKATVTTCQTTATAMNHRPRYSLELEPVPGNYLAPPEKRLARLLKTMLRAYGWRCNACHPVSPAVETPPPPDKATPQQSNV
jgi:hypothetical protein